MPKISTPLGTNCADYSSTILKWPSMWLHENEMVATSSIGPSEYLKSIDEQMQCTLICTNSLVFSFCDWYELMCINLHAWQNLMNKAILYRDIEVVGLVRLQGISH